MKLIKLLKDKSQYITTKEKVDKETGGTTWSVKYTPIRSFDKNLEELYQDFSTVHKINPNDQYLQELYQDFKRLKSQIRRHINKHYKK